MVFHKLFCLANFPKSETKRLENGFFVSSNWLGDFEGVPGPKQRAKEVPTLTETQRGTIFKNMSSLKTCKILIENVIYYTNI